MFIVDKEGFEAVENGTLYIKYDQGRMDTLEIKGENLYSREAKFIDWGCISFIDFGTAYDKVDVFMGDYSKSFHFDHHIGRDGCYDEDEKFIVLEKADVLKLQELLNDCLEKAYK